MDYDEISAPLGFGIPFVLDMVIDQRKTGVVPDDRFIDVRFADLMSDHIGTIAGIYQRLGMDFTDELAQRIRAYLDAKPRGRHGAHAYSVEHLGLDHAEMRSKFANYMTRFDIPEED